MIEYLVYIIIYENKRRKCKLVKLEIDITI